MAGAAKGLSAASLELSQQHTHPLGWQEQPRDRAAKGPSAASLELSQQHTHQLGWQEQPRDQ
ncbi:hypothetical protein FRB95_012122 [Tulasnella sp. JGI-2019a]|nr:hypothetical protein FRB95_012122 [Tulasnella sp. JGI-2019a]